MVTPSRGPDAPDVVGAGMLDDLRQRARSHAVGLTDEQVEIAIALVARFLIDGVQGKHRGPQEEARLLQDAIKRWPTMWPAAVAAAARGLTDEDEAWVDLCNQPGAGQAIMSHLTYWEAVQPLLTGEAKVRLIERDLSRIQHRILFKGPRLGTRRAMLRSFVRRGPRARGAGRPRGMRSSARSGDSGAGDEPGEPPRPASRPTGRAVA